MNRAWQYRLYPSKVQDKELHNYLYGCKNLWNSLLEHAKTQHEKTGRFPSRRRLYLLAKEKPLYSQVAQNVADRLSKSLKGMLARKKAGKKTGFPRFKSIERVKSFTYPQFGFKIEEKLILSGIGDMPIKKHRNIKGKIKTLTIKKSHSGKWYATFISEVEKANLKKSKKPMVGIDLGIETLACLSNGKTIENPRCLKQSERTLARRQKILSTKKKCSKNRRKARLRVVITHEKLTNRRRDFLHKASRLLVNNYSIIAMENLKVGNMSSGFLAKYVLDCSWAKFTRMLHYKAEEAGCEVILVNPAHTSATCSSCGLIQKKQLAERWHGCSCGASMHRDLNAARNILNRATGGTPGSQACLRRGLYLQGQASSVKQEAHTIRCG